MKQVVSSISNNYGLVPLDDFILPDDNRNVTQALTQHIANVSTTGIPQPDPALVAKLANIPDDATLEEQIDMVIEHDTNVGPSAAGAPPVSAAHPPHVPAAAHAATEPPAPAPPPPTGHSAPSAPVTATVNSLHDLYRTDCPKWAERHISTSGATPLFTNSESDLSL